MNDTTLERQPQIAFIGYTTIDTNNTPRGTKNLPGGAAYFGALAASRLVHSVGLVTRVGSDYNTEFLFSRVSPQGVKIQEDEKTAHSTQTYFSDTDPTDRDITIDWGVAAFLEGKDIPREWLRFLKFIHIATMIPTQQYNILTFIKEHAPQARISIDTDSFLLSDSANREIITASFEKSDLGFVNRKEYQLLKPTVDRLPEAVVKLDKDGAYYMKRGQKLAETRAEKVEVVDVTGAGDIFAGTFLACLLLKHSFDESLAEAAKIATLSVTKEGISHLFE